MPNPSPYVYPPSAPSPEPRPKAALQTLTASRLKTARLCQRLHRYLYEWRIRPLEEPDALRFGTLIHAGLEAWWTGPVETRLEEALSAVQAEPDPFERVKAEELLRAYDARWKDGPYRVLAVEQPFDTALRHPVTGAVSRIWRLTGRIDAVVEDLRDGRVLLVEHKTASGDVGPGTDYWRRLRLDGQISVYYEGARSLGYDIHGCLYDVLRKPAIRPLKATPPAQQRRTKDGTLYAHQRLEDETPESFRARLRSELESGGASYLQRGEVVRLEDEIVEGLSDVWDIGQQLRTSQRTGRAPKNPDACFQFGRCCPFFSVCSGEGSLDDASQFRRSLPRREAPAAEKNPSLFEEAVS